MENRKIAQDLYLLSDAVVFLTSQEKYADEVPSLFLKRIMKEGRTCYVIFNKAEAASTKEAVLSTFRSEHVSIPDDRIWLLPYAATSVFQHVSDSPAFHEFSRLFFKELSVVHNLFDTKGLAALGSYALINLFLGLRFYRRYRRVVRREAQRKEQSLEQTLSMVWEESLDALIHDLDELGNEIRSQLSSLAAPGSRS